MRFLQSTAVQRVKQVVRCRSSAILIASAVPRPYYTATLDMFAVAGYRSARQGRGGGGDLDGGEGWRGAHLVAEVVAGAQVQIPQSGQRGQVLRPKVAHPQAPLQPHRRQQLQRQQRRQTVRRDLRPSPPPLLQAVIGASVTYSCCKQGLSDPRGMSQPP